ncbi:MAG: branched-chain-amino-acid transaminase [Acidimicrobiales bacterium]
MSGAPFGSVFASSMATTRFDGTLWSPVQLESSETLCLHPGSHALHYGSSCFEGLKAHRQPDGTVVAFRADRHAARLRDSARRLCLPVPTTEVVAELIESTLAACGDDTPDPPGSLYLRPTLLGTDETIGAAAHPSTTAILYVLACPVGDYLPPRQLTVTVETTMPRTTPQFGSVKTGANYAMALGVIEKARAADSADQVLFAPGGVISETGAANVVLIDGETLLTPALTDGFLHGVTRDSLLQLAVARGWTVEERTVTVDELRDRISRPTAELALTGTAAVVASVGTVVIDGEALAVGTPGVNDRSTELRNALIDVQTGVTRLEFT